jgi:hypothetical protein
LTAWNLVRRVLDDVVPEAALDHRLALGEKGGVRFAGIYRARAGRLRMIWIASSALRRAIVLLVGVRKAGDQHDVYSELERLLRSGILDPCFERLGQTNPLR